MLGGCKFPRKLSAYFFPRKFPVASACAAATFAPQALAGATHLCDALRARLRDPEFDDNHPEEGANSNADKTGKHIQEIVTCVFA
eukprot:4266950-Pleurochrysis_carterae.AAC.1